MNNVMFRAISFLTAVISLSGCDDRPKQWDAFVYPDFEGSQKFERISGFKTFGLCQQAAVDRIKSLPEPDKADYECGYMCRYEPTYQTNVCKETKK